MLVHLSCCNSTSDWLKAAWREGRVEIYSGVIADLQTAGRGRLGNTWVSHLGNVHASFLLPCPNTAEGMRLAPRVGLMLATRAAEWLETFGKLPQPIQLKWPNDLYWENRKIGGLLIESAGSVWIVGLGLNLKDPSCEGAGSLPPAFALLGSPEEVAAGIFQSWKANDVQSESQWTRTKKEYLERAWLKPGQWIEWSANHAVRKGKIEDIGNYGELIVQETQTGQRLALWAEEVRKCRPADPRASGEFLGG
jgi:biotin-[acetyl-CoA-carboxylase] ligase BirA-like protein